MISSKCFIIGAGDSGKSTIAKQMKILFQDGYTEEERKHYIPAIHANVLNSIKDLLRGIQKYGVELSATTKVCRRLCGDWVLIVQIIGYCTKHTEFPSNRSFK